MDGVTLSCIPQHGQNIRIDRYYYPVIIKITIIGNVTVVVIRNVRQNEKLPFFIISKFGQWYIINILYTIIITWYSKSAGGLETNGFEVDA